MPSLLGKKFPAPVGMCSLGSIPIDAVANETAAKPMAPFYAAGLIILYGVNAAQNAMMNSAEFKNDPRNPNAGKAEKH
ncbi:hypothetical protein QTJ16_000622 [Diplocarpon rosae]|uniref:Uncharacterized protein n=1 Tax=Diplocarpon rosae TaxID=946125 RepID=A0AAD9T699_9HELO|nr:hypothetical protein QTJ16_000622 [Diplocarpon rosae]